MNVTYITSTIAAITIMFFAVTPTILLLFKPNQKTVNPRIKDLEKADMDIADQTNQGFAILEQRLDAMETVIEEIANERKEVTGFKKKK